MSLRTHVSYILGTESHTGKFVHYGLRLHSVTKCLDWHETTIFLYLWLHLLQARIMHTKGLSSLNCKSIPLQAWTGPEGSRRLRFPDFKTIGTWRLSAIRTGRLYSRENTPDTHFCEYQVRSEGLCPWKILMTPLGIQLATFQLVAQCLNQMRHRVTPLRWIKHTLSPNCVSRKYYAQQRERQKTKTKKKNLIFVEFQGISPLLLPMGSALFAGSCAQRNYRSVWCLYDRASLIQ